MSEFDPLFQETTMENDFLKVGADSVSSGQEEEVTSTQDVGQDEHAHSDDTVSPQLVDLGFSPTSIPETKPESPIPAPPKPVSPSSGNWMKNIDPRLVDLVYWRDLKKSGIVCGSGFVLLVSLTLFSVLSVAAYLSLALLTLTMSFVIYKKVMAAVQKTDEGHPFKSCLDSDISLPEEKLHQCADTVMKHVSHYTRELRRLFLIEDIVDSLKFGLMLWGLTYIGSWFNGMTLFILAWIGMFSWPKFYETYKVQIDKNIDMIRTQVSKVYQQVKEKLPLPGKNKKE